MTTDPKLANMMRKVQALLDLADHPTTPPAEASLSRQRAEELMVRYRIEEEELRSTMLAQGTDIKPIWDELFLCSLRSPYREHYYTLMYWVAQHVGIRVATKIATQPDGSSGYLAVMVGFESDVRVAQMLYSNVRLHFSETLEPQVDPKLSDADNVYRLRNSGMERIRIGAVLWGKGAGNEQKVTKLYVEACRARGEDPKLVGRQNNAKTYRESFAGAYTTRIYERLRNMRAMAGTESGAMVLAGRKEAVDEAFYERFPHMRPVPTTGQSFRCGKCERAASGYCRAHRPVAGKERPYSSLGATSGYHAANSADLGSTTRGTRLPRPDNKSLER